MFPRRKPGWEWWIAASVAAVIVFFPAEGRVLTPLHDVLGALLGQAVFIVPLGLALVGALALVRYARPGVGLPRRRLVGLALIAMAVLPGERLLGDSTGLVGDWLTTFLVELAGEPITVVIVLITLAVGAVLVLDLRVRRPPVAAR
jgi:hypothetical protein